MYRPDKYTSNIYLCQQHACLILQSHDPDMFCVDAINLIHTGYVICLTFRHKNMGDYFLVNLDQILGLYFLMILLEPVICLCYLILSDQI